MNRSDSLRTPLFAATLGLGSLLMFLLEPMIAKMLLPGLGGAPMVWNTCLVFFQATLLLGYGCVHLARTRLGLRGAANYHSGGPTNS